MYKAGDGKTKGIAKVILSQLKVNTPELWAWGSNNYVHIYRGESEEKMLPALMFTIRTPKVKRGGRVIISLNEGLDDYIVEAIRVHGKEEISLGKSEGVYFNELHRVINSLIEDEETYTKVTF